ncbi:MAG: hypothetical protein WCO52_06260 [bacterium]
MSIYDTLLGTVGQGYAQANQNAMAQAQMPTFADRFLAGLRQNTEDEYKRKMGEGSLAMNQAYKLSQEQQMRDNARIHQAQMTGHAMDYVSNNLTGSNRPEVAAYLQSIGIDQNVLPTKRFDASPYSYTEVGQDNAPAYQGMSLAEGGEQTAPETTVNGVASTPVPFSDWGTNAAFKQKTLDLKQMLGEMSANGKLKMMELKQMEPKSALGKLNYDYDRYKGTDKEISDADYAQMRFHLSNVVNPQSGPAMAQGIVIAPYIGAQGPSGSNLPGGGVPPTLPGSSPSIGGSPAPADGGVAKVKKLLGINPPAGVLPAPDPNSVKGRENAIETANERAKAEGALIPLNNLDININKALSALNTSSSGAFVPFTGIVGRSATPAGVALRNLMTSIQTGEIVNQITAMKDRGVGLGRVTQMEWVGLGNLISSLSLDQDDATLTQNLRQIATVLSQIKTKLQSGSQGVIDARNPNTITPQTAPRSSIVNPTTGQVMHLSADGTKWE